MNLSNCGNVVIPSIKVLLDLGYCVVNDQKTNTFTAKKEGSTFNAEDPVALLGLIKLFEVRGEKWQLPDQELDEIGRQYKLL